jgi:hypothetical protein
MIENGTSYSFVIICLTYLFYSSRAYDRILPRRTPSASHVYNPRAPPTRSSSRSSATYAWEHPSRTRRSHYNPEWSSYNHPHPEQSPHQQFSPHLSFRGTPRQKAEEEDRAMDRVRNESGLKRALQLMGLMFVSVGVFGGWGGR